MLPVELVCVAPARINEVWPLASHLIKSACDRTALSDFSVVEREVMAGDQLLWLAWSDHIEAAATTKIVKSGQHKICILVACGGEGRDRWLSLFEQIEKYAKDENCRCVRIFGRRGWKRALTGYRVQHVVLEKVL
jgi:hypothetical protein